MNTDPAKGEAQKILTFFGLDLKGKSSELLQAAYSKGYALLALDTGAVGLAAKALVPYSVIDDWIDSEAMFQARAKAAECERKWFEAARSQFTLDGVCWPDFDRHAMHWFWQNVTLASAFAEVFQTGGGRDLRFCQHPVRRPGVYYYPSDVCSTFWEADLADRARPLEKSQKPFWHRVFHYIWLRLCEIARSRGKSTATEGPANIDPSILAGKLVLAFNPGEFLRFTPVIEQLSASFPGKIAAVVLSPDQRTASNIAARWSFPVVCGALHTPIDVSLQNRFLEGYLQALSAAGEHPWRKPLEYVRFHFEYYCNQRWPRLVADFRSWSDLLTEARPEGVLVSSLYDGESQLPAEAAKRLNIPTFSIPHGGVVMADNILSSDHILYSLPIQKTIFECGGIEAHRLTACRRLVPENEYHSVPIHILSKHNNWPLLVLTNPCGFPGNLCPAISIRDQIVALRVLDNPPEDISEKLSLKIKVHPGYPEAELFTAVGNGLIQKVLPVNSDLESVSKQISLVVAQNYYGSALVHVLRLGKPVIFFWTVRQITADADIFLPAGILVSKPEELWDLVRKFFTQSDFAKQMCLKAREFSAQYLDDSNNESIGEVMSGILSWECNLDMDAPLCDRSQERPIETMGENVGRL